MFGGEGYGRGFLPQGRAGNLNILSENNRKISITIEICITIDPPSEESS